MRVSTFGEAKIENWKGRIFSPLYLLTIQVSDVFNLFILTRITQIFTKTMQREFITQSTFCATNCTNAIRMVVGFAFLCRDSAIHTSMMALAAPSVVGFAFLCRDSAIHTSMMALAAPSVREIRCRPRLRVIGIPSAWFRINS